MRADDAQVVDALGHVRKQLAHPHARSGRTGANFQRRSQQVAGLGRNHARLGERQRLAVVALEQRLVVERIDLRRPAVHEQEDHPLGLARAKCGGRTASGFAGRSSPARAFLAQQARPARKRPNPPPPRAAGRDGRASGSNSGVQWRFIDAFLGSDQSRYRNSLEATDHPAEALARRARSGLGRRPCWRQLGLERRR